MKKLVVLPIGNSFKPAGDVKVAKHGNKASRRMLRALSKKTRIERKIVEAQEERAQSHDLANNSHAARRLVEQERRPKR